MLYIVATPIGNLDDLSLRQAKTITNCEILLAEDTRSAHKIISAIKEKFGLVIKKDLIIQSFYKENEFELTYKILKELEQNKNISIISESPVDLIFFEKVSNIVSISFPILIVYILFSASITITGVLLTTLLPEPVTPKSTWLSLPAFNPLINFAIACG